MKSSVSKQCFLVVVWLLLCGFTVAAEVVPGNGAVKVGLSVVKRVPVDYFLLIRGQPLDFKVSAVPDTGAWLRVYTRVWWGKGEEKEQEYVIAFLGADTVKRFTLRTAVSGSTLGPKGQKVGRWRSFFVRINPGRERFRLLLDSAPKDTVAVRFSFEAPRQWERLKLTGLKRLTLVTEGQGEKNREEGFYQVNCHEPYEFSVKGPCRVRIRARINFDPTMEGSQVFVLKVEEKDGIVLERTLRSKKEHGVYYKEMGNVVPATERRLSFELGDGIHRLRVLINGTVARTGAIAVERLLPEKYE